MFSTSISTLHATNAFISGSFALYWYLNQHVGQVDLPEKSDLDIYVPITTVASYRHIQICLNSFDLLLEESGYKRDGNLIHSGYYNSAYIRDVQTYTHEKTHRSIQIIFVAQPQEYRPIFPTDVTSTFDLDICKFVVNSDLEVTVPETFKKMSVEEIHSRLNQKLMTQTLENVQPKNMNKYLARLEKYYQRGFKVEVTEPCSTCKCSTVKRVLTLEGCRQGHGGPLLPGPHWRLHLLLVGCRRR
jgi:hypothetical protein